MTKRLFISIDLPEPMKREFAIWQSRFGRWLKVRWIPAENFHLTVVFLGSVSEEKIPLLIQFLKLSLSRQKPFTLEFKTVGWAPEKKEYSMLWAEFGSPPEFNSLVRSCTLSAAQFVSLDPRHRQHPHLTLARFKEPLKKIDLIQPIVSQKNFSIDRINLVESKLSPTGSTYRVLEEIKFGNNE